MSFIAGNPNMSPTPASNAYTEAVFQLVKHIVGRDPELVGLEARLSESYFAHHKQEQQDAIEAILFRKVELVQQFTLKMFGIEVGHESNRH